MKHKHAAKQEIGDGLPEAPCSLWTCCGRSRRSKFCPECGTQAPVPTGPIEMLAEFEIEVRKYNTTIDTFSAKAEETEKAIGHLPENCGWTMYNAAMLIDPYKEDKQLWSGRMPVETLRDRFGAALRKKAIEHRRQAAAATKQMLKWKRWHRILESLMSQANNTNQQQRQ